MTEWPSSIKGDGDAFPSTDIAAYIGGEACISMRWGMIPNWAKSFESKYPTHNARIETLEDKATYKAAWLNQQRCIIPMIGYYEWTGPKGSKTKWYITDKDTEGLAIAGLWESWNDQHSCTMVTRESKEHMVDVNHRMLCYLTPETSKPWPIWRDGQTGLRRLGITKRDLLSV